MILKLNLNQTIVTPKGLKVAFGAQKGNKKATNRVELKQKDRAVPPKPKLVVYIGRSQKSF